MVAPEQPINAKLLGSFKKSALAAAIVVLMLSIAEMAGYAFDIGWIKHPIEDSTIPSGMTSGSAVSFFLIAIGLLLRAGKPGHWRRILSIAVGCVVVAAAAAALLEHLCQQDWNLNFALWQPASGGADLSFPGPMLPDTATSVILLGLAIVLTSIKLGRTEIYPYQILVLFAGLPNLMIIVCYFGGMVHLSGYFGCFKYSLVTSLMFAGAAYSLLLLNPENGFTSVLMRDTRSGAIFRRSIPAVIALLSLLPLRLWLIAEGTRLQVLDETLATGLVATIGLAIIAVFVIWCSRNIDNIDTRTQAQEPVKESEQTSIAQQNFKPGMTFCPEDGGTKLGERYEVLSVIARGGMGVVYRCRHILLDKIVAIKVLNDTYMNDPSSVARFQHEAKVASQLTHPNIGGVHDFGVTEEKILYLVMDFIEGETLGEILDEKAHVPVPRVLEIARQLCDGLEYAHDQGLIHRDLKPSNIMLVKTKDGLDVVKILDFGLAKFIDEGKQQALSQTGYVLGTGFYMSPEQSRGKSADVRSEIYALGCVLYEAITGLPPLVGENLLETCQKHIEEIPLAMSQTRPDLEIPEALEAIVRRALEKDPQARFQSAIELKKAIEEMKGQPDHGPVTKVATTSTTEQIPPGTSLLR